MGWSARRDRRNGGGAPLGTRLLTWLRGELVGSDAYGNRYYRLKGDKPKRLGGGRFSRERRWVIYNGEPEGSKVDRKSTRLNSSHSQISYAVFCLKTKIESKS